MTPTTTERLSHEAELMALSNTHPVSSRASSFIRDPSPPPPPPPDIPNLGAASMVQKWRVMEHRRLHCSDASSDCTDDGEVEVESELRRLRGSSTCQGGEMGVHSPRVRGRRALLELLERVAGDRKLELEGLEQRQSVTRFPHRVRIQSVLRLRLCNGIPRSPLHVSDFSPPLLEQSAVSTLRQRFHWEEVRGGSVTVCGSNEKEDAEEQSLCGIDADTNNKEDPGENVAAYVEEKENETIELHEPVEGREKEEDYGESVAEEKEEDKPVTLEATCDWVSHISRPQRDWEDSRRARYEEMMLHDNEICHLLDRRSVSSFLVSEYKDRMDRLMTTIAQRQISRIHPNYLGEDQTSMGHDRLMQPAKEKEEIEEYIEDAEGVDEDYRFGGENSSDILSPSPPYPSRSHSSNDLVQTHHLAKDIEELRQEMQELKKLIKSSHPNTCGKNKRDCFVCHEMEVDSLLYRCGHVCTCIRCARELQGGGRSCPVCHAPIDDVVQIILPLA